MQVNLPSDSFFSQFFIVKRSGKYRLTFYSERGSLVLNLDRTDLEAIEKFIAGTLRPIPTLTDRIDPNLTFDTI